MWLTILQWKLIWKPLRNKITKMFYDFELDHKWTLKWILNQINQLRIGEYLEKIATCQLLTCKNNFCWARFCTGCGLWIQSGPFYAVTSTSLRRSSKGESFPRRYWEKLPLLMRARRKFLRWKRWLVDSLHVHMGNSSGDIVKRGHQQAALSWPQHFKD